MTNTSHKRIYQRIGIIGALAGILILVAGCRHKTPEERLERVQEHITDEFDLNESQQSQLNDVGEEVLALIKDIRDEREKDRAEVMAQLASSALDKSKIMAMYEARKAKFEAKFPAILDKVATLHQSLNDEQRAELVEKAEKLQRWHK